MADTNTIKYGEGNLSGVNMPLIPFNCIFDTDVSLLLLIRKEYLDPSVFDKQWFDSHRTVMSIVGELYNREHPNPLTVCLKDKSNIKLADDLYNQFISQKYTDILKTPVTTEIFNLLRLFKIEGEIKATLLYNTDLEGLILEEFCKDTAIISFKDLLVSGVDIYQQFFFKSILNDVYMDTLADSIRVKNIYLAGYKFNSNDEYLKESKSLLRLAFNRNFIRTMDIYNKIKLYGGQRNNENN